MERIVYAVDVNEDEDEDEKSRMEIQNRLQEEEWVLEWQDERRNRIKMIKTRGQ